MLYKRAGWGFPYENGRRSDDYQQALGTTKQQSTMVALEGQYTSGQKVMVAGWKVKSLPPFSLSYELILTMALPANILDGFRIYCPFTTVEEWVERVQTVEEIEVVA